MKTIHIFAKCLPDQGLTEFSECFFTALSAGAIEERFSSNYFGGRYFVAEAGAITWRIAAVDEEGFDDYAFWIAATMESDDSSEVQLRIAAMLSSKDLAVRFGLARIEDFGRATAKAVPYSASAAST